MGTILCIVDKSKTKEHAEDLNGKGSLCHAKNPAWVGWERRQKFKVTMDEKDASGKARLATNNVMVLMEGDRYDIQFEEPGKVKRVDKVKIREMFRLKPNGESALDDVHWKTRPKSEACAIWSIANLSLTLWDVQWTPEGHADNSKHAREKYKQGSTANEAPVACNNNDPRGYLEGTLDDPTFDEITKKQLGGYSGDASYSYAPWHCALIWATLQDFLNWLRLVNEQVKKELGDSTFSLWSIMGARSRNGGDVVEEVTAPGGPRGSLLAPFLLPVAQPGSMLQPVTSLNSPTMLPVTSLRAPHGEVESRVEAAVGVSAPAGRSSCACGPSECSCAGGVVSPSGVTEPMGDL